MLTVTDEHLHAASSQRNVISQYQVTECILAARGRCGCSWCPAGGTYRMRKVWAGVSGGPGVSGSVMAVMVAARVWTVAALMVTRRVPVQGAVVADPQVEGVVELALVGFG